MAVGDLLTYNPTALTATITLTSLASATTNNARQGTTVDFTATRAERYVVRLRVSEAATPTAGGTWTVHMSFSSATATLVNTNFPGGCTGVDGTYTGPDGAPNNGVQQMEFIGSLIIAATSSTVDQMQNVGVCLARERYGVPVVRNNTSQAGSSNAGSFELVFIPIIEQGQTA